MATHWLPNILAVFGKQYPNIEYELLLGDYAEIEQWIADGRIDFGFLRLPTDKGFDCIELERDQQMVVLPVDHPLAGAEVFPVEALNDYPFIMVEKGLGIAILPKLILQRVSYRIVTKPLNVEAYRTIGIAMKNRQELSLAAKRFLEYMDYRSQSL